jgi:hypothetical protein
MGHEGDGGCSDHLPEIQTVTEEGKAHLTTLSESQIDSKNQGEACVRRFHRRAFADFMQHLPERVQSRG